MTGVFEDAGVYATEHAPEERVHEAECEKLPEPLVDHDTVPVGEEPATVAVQVAGEPAASGDGEQETAVEEPAAFTVRLAVPEDPESKASPE